MENHVLFLLYSLLTYSVDRKQGDTRNFPAFLKAMERILGREFLPDMDVRHIQVVKLGSDLENFTRIKILCTGRCRKGELENPEALVSIVCHDEGGIAVYGETIVEG